MTPDTSRNLFDLTASSDDDLVAGFSRAGRVAVYDKAGVSLVLHCLYRGREGASRALVAAGHRCGTHEAAALGDTKMLARLLDAAPWSIDLHSPDGWTALHLAAFFGRTEAAMLLVARGADGAVWSRSFERNLAIHAAAAGRARDLAMIETLIAASRDVDAVQEEGYSALLIAASDGKTDWVEALRKAGADPDRRTRDGKGIAELMPTR